MAYKIATFKDEKGNLFVEHECQSSEDKIVLVRAIDAQKAQGLLDKVNESLKDFWRKKFENGLYNCDWFGFGVSPLDDNGNYVAVNGSNGCNLTLILPEEWSEDAVDRTANKMIEFLAEKYGLEIKIEDIDHDYVFLSVDFLDINLKFNCNETFTYEE